MARRDGMDSPPIAITARHLAKRAPSSLYSAKRPRRPSSPSVTVSPGAPESGFAPVSTLMPGRTSRAARYSGKGVPEPVDWRSVSSNMITPLTCSAMPSAVNSSSRNERRASSLGSTPAAWSRLSIVPVLSSAARIPFPGATIAAAIASISLTLIAHSSRPGHAPAAVDDPPDRAAADHDRLDEQRSADAPRRAHQRPAGDPARAEERVARSEIVELQHAVELEPGRGDRLRLGLALRGEPGLHPAAERADGARGHDALRGAADAHQQVGRAVRQKRLQRAGDISVGRRAHPSPRPVNAGDQVLVARL